MDKWLKKFSGAFIASVLALTLNSTAFADLGDEPVPDQPVPQYEEKAAETGAMNTVVPVPESSANDEPAKVSSDSKEASAGEAVNPAADTKSTPVDSEPQNTEVKSAVSEGEKPDNGKPDTVSETKTALIENKDPDSEIKVSESKTESKAEGNIEESGANNDAPVKVADSDTDNNVIKYSSDDTAPVKADNGTDSAAGDKSGEGSKSGEGYEPDNGNSTRSLTITSVDTESDADNIVFTRSVTLNAAPASVANTEVFTEEGETDPGEQMRSSGETDTENEESGTIIFNGTVFTPGISDSYCEDNSIPPADEMDTGKTILWGYNAGDSNNTNDDILYMVNHDGSSQTLASTNSDINIIAAGLNRLGSIKADGNVNLTGTGILLVDNVELSEGHGFFLHPIAGIYNSGSVAVFLRQADSSETESTQGENTQEASAPEAGQPKTVYKMINGSDVPGILDENYTLPDDISLIVPGTSSLILQSTIQETHTEYSDNGDQISEKVTTYATQPDYSAATEAYNNSDNKNKYSYVCSAPQLTVPASSGLALQTGAVISMNSLKGFFSAQSIIPTFTVNGSLDNSGSIVGNSVGVVDFGKTSHVSGTGTYKDCLVYYKSQDHSESQKLTLNLEGTSVNSSWFYLGCDVNIDNATTADESIVSFDDLNINGICSLVFAGGSSIDSINLTDNSALDMYAHNLYMFGCPITLNNGITGSGKILLKSGNYFITDSNFDIGESVSVSAADYAVTVSDVSGKLSSKLTPTDISILANPASIALSPSNVAVYTVDIHNKQNYHSDSLIWKQPDSSTGVNCRSIDLTSTGLNLVSSDGSVSFPAIANAFNIHFTDDLHYIEVYTISNNKLTRHIIQKTASGYTPGSVPADEIWQIRLVSENWTCVAPGNAVLTSDTTATGSGIIGGNGAGSVTGGTGISILTGVGITAPTDDGHDSGDNGDENGNSNGGENGNSNNPSGDNGSSNNNSGNSENNQGFNDGSYNDYAPPMTLNQDTTVSNIEITVTEKEVHTSALLSLEEAEPVYTLSVIVEKQPVTKLTDSITVRFTCPAPKTNKQIFVVFRDENGSLKVFKARYDRIKGQLVFDTDMLGDFAVVFVDFKVDINSDDFYKYLETLENVKSLSD